MRHALRLLGTRYGVALVLCLLVLGVVGLFRGVAGSRRAEPVAPVITTSSRPVIDPAAGDDGPAEAAGNVVATPSLSAGATAPSTVANAFVGAWLNHTGVTAQAWLAALTPYATQGLIAKLTGADPAGVPANRATGAVQLNTRDAALVEATIPVDSGTVRLRLLVDKGRWRVDGVDWERPT
jgi:hypothetical protein